MRELKFRVWHPRKNNGCYIAMGMTIQQFQKDAAESLELPLLMSESGVIIEQFTGIKDANGTDIYEGDIVEYASDEYWNKNSWIVSFNNLNYGKVCGWNLVELDDDQEPKEYYYGDSPDSSYVVVGNILELKNGRT